MKKIILFAVCLLTASTAINAQTASTTPTTKQASREKMTVEQRAQKNVDDLNAVATLSDDQKVRVKDLALNRIKKAEAVRTKYKGQSENKETSKNEIEVLRKDYRQNVKALLTAEQIEKVKAKNKELHATRGPQFSETAIDAND